MKYLRLGKNGPIVSRISLGNWLTHGQSTSDQASKECIIQAYENGINFFDTADVYGYGAAERFLGACLKEFPREKIVIGTKCFFPISETQKGLSKKHITESVERSLTNLQTEYIDIMQCHRYDPETPLEETVSTMGGLIREGKILNWGISRWTQKQTNDAISLCLKNSIPLPVSNQCPYNIFNNDIEAEFFTSVSENSPSIVAYSPLAQGVLTGKYKNTLIAPEGSRALDPNAAKGMWNYSEKCLAQVEKISTIANKMHCSLSQLAIAWTLRNSLVASVTIGATKPNQIIENIKALEYEFSAGQLDEIEVIMNRHIKES